MLPKTAIARITASLSIVLILALLGAVAWTQWLSPEPRRTAGTGIGGPFELVNTEGETVTARDLRGRHLLVFFGYTHCPDVCPATLNAMSRALDVLSEEQPERARAVTPVFVTIDPARDDIARMKQYLANFHPRTIGLTGSAQQIARAADAYHVSYKKVPPDQVEAAGAGGESGPADGTAGDAGEDGGADHAAMDHGAYLMQHSSFVFLMGPEGRHLAHVNATAGAPRIAEMIRTHVRR